MPNRRQGRCRCFSVLIGCLLLGISLSCTNSANGQDLRVASSEAPRYELSNLRTERDHIGRSVLAVDYKLKSKGTGFSGLATISGKSKNGPLRVMGVGRLDDSGVMRISINGFGMGGIGGLGYRGNDYEIYFVVDEHSQSPQLVSNILRLGDPGPETKARPWTEQEKAAAAKQKLFKTPPKALPEGYVAASQGTTLVPGMPVKAGYYGDWADAEVISFKVGGDVMLKYKSEDRLQPHEREKWIAISPEVLAKVKEDPSQFQPSVRTLKDSRLIIPDGAVAVADDLALVPGTPLLMDYHSRWRDVYFLETSGGQVIVRDKVFGPSWDKTLSRCEIVISNNVLEQLQESDIAAKFASNIVLKEARSGQGFPSRSKSKRKIRHKQYVIDIQLPEDSRLVPADLKVESGTALAGCWADKWHPLTALLENPDGSIHVRWDDFSSGFDCDMTRDQLVIEDEVIQQLRQKAKRTQKVAEARSNPESKSEQNSESISESDLKQTLRTWTNSTGKYKVEAWYVSHDDRQIRLKTAAGRELRMPIEKLSAADRKLLSSLESTTDSENPFE